MGLSSRDQLASIDGLRAQGFEGFIRIGKYLRFGQGEPVGHWGGRLRWQIHEGPYPAQKPKKHYAANTALRACFPLECPCTVLVQSHIRGARFFENATVTIGGNH